MTGPGSFSAGPARFIGQHGTWLVVGLMWVSERRRHRHSLIGHWVMELDVDGKAMKLDDAKFRVPDSVEPSYLGRGLFGDIYGSWDRSR